MNKAIRSEKDVWLACTAEGAREDVLDQFRGMTLREKVDWLDEAEQVALRFRLTPKQAPSRQPVSTMGAHSRTPQADARAMDAVGNHARDMRETRDTAPQANAFHLRLLRAASPVRRVHIACTLSDTTRHLSRRAIDEAHPNWTARQRDVFFVRLHFGAELAGRLDEYLMRPDDAKQ